MAWSTPILGTVATVASGNITLTEPASPATGDLQIATISYRDTAPFTVPGDWNLVDTQQSSGNLIAGTGTAIGSGLMMWRIRGATSGTLTFNRTLGDVGYGRIKSYRWTGGAVGDVIDFDDGHAETMAAQGTTNSNSGVNVSAGGLVVVMSAPARNTTNSAYDATDPGTASVAIDTTTAPTVGTWIERVDTFTTTGADCGLGTADAVRSTAGATGTINCVTPLTSRMVMIAASFKITPASGTYTLTATVGAYTLGGQDVALTTARDMMADVGPFVLAGQGVTLTKTGVSPSLSADFGAFVLSGQAVSLRADRLFTAGLGGFTYAGQAVGLKSGRLVSADVGAFVLAGQEVTLTRTGVTNYTMPANVGSFDFAGMEVGLLGPSAPGPFVRRIRSGAIYIGLPRDPVGGLPRNPVIQRRQRTIF